LAAELARETVIERDGLADGNDGVRPTLNQDDLAAAIVKLADVAGHRAVERRPQRGSTFTISGPTSKARQSHLAQNLFENTVTPRSPRALNGVSRKSQLKSLDSLPVSSP
jgi:hypothetical protein